MASKIDFYSRFNGIESLQNCVVAINNKVPIGSGAFKPFDTDSVEIKRIYEPYTDVETSVCFEKMLG